MKKIFSVLLLSITSLFVPEIQGLDQQAMIQDLESAKYKFSSRYAMSEWKAEQFNWTLEGASDHAKMRILTQDPSVKGYQKIFNEFIQSTKDYHVRAVYYSTAISFFPLNIKGANGRYYIAPLSSIDFSGDTLFFIPLFENIEQEEFQNLIHFEAGDEVISFNGTPIQEVIEKIIDEDLGGDRTPTGYALAEKAIFFRTGKYGMSVPSGSFEITVRHKDQKNLSSYPFKWIHIRELIEDPTEKKIAKNVNSSLNQSLVKLLAKDYIVGFAKDLLRYEKALKLKKRTLKKGTSFTETSEDTTESSNFDELEEDEDFREKGFLPQLGQILWETNSEDTDIYAYLYLNEQGQKIGYLYIPTFMEEGDYVADQIVKIVRHLEQESQALIVDITNNPGGNLLYTYAVLSTLTNAPLKALPERQVLLQEDVYDAIFLNNLLSSMDDILEGKLSGYPISDNTIKGITSYNQQIIQSWNSGKRVTDLLYPLGITEIEPHPEAQYTKPLIVLTNELDFSCADWFPAILQDNGRAIVFGSKTAGAGGSVKPHSHMSQFGVQTITITGSIGFRLDGQPIENLGVTPDISYQVTEQDLKENYVDYKRSLNKVVEILIK